METESVQQLLFRSIKEEYVNPHEPSRRSGRTTRLIDDYVQRIFTEPIGSTIYLSDHHVGESLHSHIKSTEYLTDKLFKRLQNEHNIKIGVPFMMYKNLSYTLKYDRAHRSITIIEQYEGDKKSS